MAESVPALNPQDRDDGSAVLDEAHLGDIQGALGTIGQHDTAPRRSVRARVLTLLAILGPGL
ncbi:MAG: manganese transporter, partial [Acidimicrobiales bacterium]